MGVRIRLRALSCSCVRSYAYDACTFALIQRKQGKVEVWEEEEFLMKVGRGKE
jgi:hypothetical protein